MNDIRTRFPRSVACKKPTFKDHRGRTWDICDVIAGDGSKHNGWLDTSWGTWFYFEVEGKWRKARCDEFMIYLNNNTADFRKQDE